MKKIDPVVRKETRYIAVWTLLFSALMQAVFLLIGQWDLTVLWGNLLTAAVSIGNFFFMAVYVVKAMEKEEKEAKQTLRLSKSMRFLVLLVAVVVGVLLFNIWATLIPLLFPRIAIALRPLMQKKSENKGGTK
jgi:hypothetical protein